MTKRDDIVHDMLSRVRQEIETPRKIEPNPTVKVAGNSEVEVTAYTTPTPGLIVHRDLNVKEEWRVTHQASGLDVGGRRLTSRRHALTIAAALGEIGDWTEDARELNKPGMKQSVDEIYDACDEATLNAIDEIRKRHDT